MSAPTATPTRGPWHEHPLALVAGAGALGVLLGYYGLLFRTALAQHGNDFGKFYFATKAWLAGGSLYEPNIATRMLIGGEWHEFLNMNPPHFHLLLLPFVGLDLLPAFVGWTALNAGTALASVGLTLRELRWTVRPVALLPIAVVGLVAGAANAVAATGQVTGLLMLPMTLSWLAARRNRWVACGAWLGVLIGLKPFLALFIPIFALTGRWRAIASALLAGTGTFAIGLAVFRWPAHLEWLRSLQSVSWAWSSMNASIMGVAARNLAPSPVFTPLLVKPAWPSALWFATALPTAWLSVAASRRSVDHLFAAATLGALLISPLGWIYYLPLALGPCLALWQHQRPRTAMVGLVLTSVPMFVPLLWGARGVAALTIGSVYFWGTGALWIAVLLTRRAGDASHGVWV